MTSPYLTLAKQIRSNLTKGWNVAPTWEEAPQSAKDIWLGRAIRQMNVAEPPKT